jgi:hypothetical protein
MRFFIAARDRFSFQKVLKAFDGRNSRLRVIRLSYMMIMPGCIVQADIPRQEISNDREERKSCSSQST